MYSPWLDYPLNYLIQYSTDDEYRKCVDVLFHSRSNTNTSGENINTDSDNTEPLSVFDDEAACIFIDAILTETVDIPALRSLYTAAARELMTEDPSIGMVVLLSYDNLIHFHSCLSAMFGGNSIEDNIGYITLLQKFTQSSSSLSSHI